MTLLRERLPLLSRLLETSPVLERRRRWEGELTITRAVNPGFVFRVVADIAIHGELIEGTGRSHTMPYDLSGRDAEFTLAGTSAAGALAFQVWFAAAEWRARPFIASGHLSSDGRQMSGDWSTQCMQPRTCGCDGLGGPFRLHRIDQ